MSNTFDSVTTKVLNVVDDAGKQVATLRAAEGGAGLWLEGPAGDTVAIYAINGQSAVGIYDKESKSSGNGIPLALTVAQGVPTVQFRDRAGAIQSVPLEDLLRAANTVRVWKLGNLDHHILPTAKAINTLATMLEQQKPGEDFDLIWDPAIEVVELKGTGSTTIVAGPGIRVTRDGNVVKVVKDEPEPAEKATSHDMGGPVETDG